MTRLEEDYEAIRAQYPFTVQITTQSFVNFQAGDWLTHLDNDMIVVSNIRLGSKVGPRLITFVFAHEADAVLFRLTVPNA